MRSLLPLALALVLGAGCKKKQDEPPPPNNPPPIPAAELKRGEDACNGYVAKACACAETVPAAEKHCEDAKAFPEVLRMAGELSMSKDSSPMDVKQAAMTLRKTIESCIEQTAQLSNLGCKP